MPFNATILTLCNEMNSVDFSIEKKTSRGSSHNYSVVQSLQ